MQEIDPMDVAKDTSFITEAEKEFYYSILDSFRSYKYVVRDVMKKHIKSLQAVSTEDKALLSDYESHLHSLMQLSEHNQDFLNQVAKGSEEMFSNIKPEFNRYETISSSTDDLSSKEIDLTFFDKLKTTLKQVVREWSELGAEERAECFDPIIKAVEEHFDGEDGQKVYILFPGAGLGRLAFELSIRGYICQANEVSLFMLFTSNYIINGGHACNSKRIYPWITQFSNNLTYADQSACVRLPDVDTFGFDSPRFTTVAGCFLDVYREADMWDSVVTCFFIDTANNFIDYIRRIFMILKPGGIWINLGPLTYHFSGVKNEISIEAPYETVKQAMVSIGFEITAEKFNLSTRYLQSPRSMLAYEYRSVFFIARKPEEREH